MPAKHELASPIVHPPHPRGVVVAARNQPLAVRREGQVLNDVGVPFQQPHHLQLRQRDEVNRLTISSRSQRKSPNREPLAIWRERGGVELAFGTIADGRAERPQRLAAGHVPQPDRLVLRDRDQLFPIRREQHLPYHRRMPPRVERQSRLVVGESARRHAHHDQQPQRSADLFHGCTSWR